MRLLLVSATSFEIAPFVAAPQPTGIHIETLVTGVGMVATTYALTRRLAAAPCDFVLQVGVGGSFDPSIQPGDLRFIDAEQFGDLGAEDHDRFLTLFDLGLHAASCHPFQSGWLPTPPHPLHQLLDLQRASGLTVNTVSGSAATIAARSRFHAQVESMEGAALHYVCLMESVPFAQVRAISNYVAPRDKSQWRMQEAIAHLNQWLAGFVQRIQP